MARGSFFDRTEELSELVGHGVLEGKVTYDQVYAFAQEESTWLTGPLAGHVIHNHPDGGGAKYLGGTLVEESALLLQTVADHVLEDGPVAGMKDTVEKLADDSAARAPIEFGDLRESAHPQVFSDGALVYDRPPIVPRLSKEQLKAKEKAAEKGDYRRTYLPSDHPSHGTLHEVHGGTHSHARATKPTPITDTR